jgi:hypothetical protein
VSAPTPTQEPLELHAGDTWQWRREDLADYPASVWTLKYRFKNAAGGFEITATADGDSFAISVAAATTAAYVAGEYDWVAWVGDGTGVYTIAEGRAKVLPDVRAGVATLGLDLRTDARKYLDGLKAALLARDPSLAAFTFQTAAGARTKTFSTLAEVRAELDRAQADVAREAVADSIAKGEGNPRRLFVRFGRV